MAASAEQAEECGAAWQDRKVCQSDVAVLTGNIRQQSTLQINVQQVLSV